MSAYVFPGQGAQKRGMGAALFNTVPEFTAVEAEIDHMLGYSVRQLCLENPGDRLSDTSYAQPALYVVNALHYYSAVRSGGPARLVAGHSLGEYNALLAAGAFSFMTGLRIVKRRGELMSTARGGAMAAVVGLRPARVMEVLESSGLGDLDVANYNSPLQTVISGPAAAITRAAPIFERAGAQLYLPLAVSGAFHSRYMREAAGMFAQFLLGIPFGPLAIPVISNVTGAPYPAGRDTEAIRDLLTRQITQPVQWTRSVQYLLNHEGGPCQEVGPGDVLSRLIQQIRTAADS